jgi:hypothetical protein
LTCAPSKRSDLAAQILAYLLERPTAADSARGACEWWVGSKTLVDVIAVEEALEELAAEHLVRFDVLPDGTRLWSAGPALLSDPSANSSNNNG